MTASDSLGTILTPNGILGYGLDLRQFWHAVNFYRPGAIIVDAGSTDPGPSLLGTGATLCSRLSIIRDLTPVLQACAEKGLKFLVSSAGGAGTNAQVDDFVSIVQEVCEVNGWKLKVAAIYSEITKDLVASKVKAGLVIPCGDGPAELTEEAVGASKMIVAQMGPEPYLELLKDSSIDVIVGGRSYDPAPFAAYGMHMGMGEAVATHMGKIMECGALCALPKGRTIVATMHKDSFDLTPINPIERCSPLSVAAHTLYEKTRPDLLPGPGGVLDLTNARYEQLADGRSVRVSKSEFIHSKRYEVKLEGVEQLGYRSIFIGGIRDPTLIAGIEPFLDHVKAHTAAVACPELLTDPEHYRINFHIYGKNGVMGPLEPTNFVPIEIGILGEITAPTQEKATSIAGFSRVNVLHAPYEGQLATAGNFALPLTPLESPIGPVYKFSLYHLMDIHSEEATLFPVKISNIGARVTNGTNGVNGYTAFKATASSSYLPLEPVVLGPVVKKTVPSEAAPMSAIASIVRSKNSGPFQITLDILFDDVKHYERVRDSGVLNSELIMKSYQLKKKSDIVTLMFFPAALAWKCTIIRPWIQGSIGEADTFGTQQHAPLLDVLVPAAV